MSSWCRDHPGTPIIVDVYVLLASLSIEYAHGNIIASSSLIFTSSTITGAECIIIFCICDDYPAWKKRPHHHRTNIWKLLYCCLRIVESSFDRKPGPITVSTARVAEIWHALAPGGWESCQQQHHDHTVLKHLLLFALQTRPEKSKNHVIRLKRAWLMRCASIQDACKSATLLH